MRYYALDPIGQIENLTKKERPIPEAKGALDVVIKMQAVSLNYKDLALARGWLPLNNGGQEHVPLSDGAGLIVAKGAHVQDLEIGDRVVAGFFPDWREGNPKGDEKSLGHELSGMLSEYVCLPAKALMKIPNAIDFASAAAFPCAGVTAWNALMEKGVLSAGQTVLTMGTGGVAMFALQIAKATGAKVISLTGSKEKEAVLRANGADHVINYKRIQDWDREVHDYTNGAGADIIVETGGAQTFQRSLNAAAFSGRISAVGVLAGTEGMADPTSIIFKSLTVNGIFVGSTEMLGKVLKFFETNDIRPVVDAKPFGFDDACRAFAHLAQQRHVGKVIINFA